MKKKILALLMVMVLTMITLVGCGDKKSEKTSSTKTAEEKSSFFKELGELSELNSETKKVQLKYVIKNDGIKNTKEAKDFLDADGNLTVDLTMDIVTESETKVAVDVAAKIGSKIDGKMMTIVVDGEEVYLEYARLIDALRGLNNEQLNNGIAQIESNFGKAVKVNFNTVKDAVSQGFQNAAEQSENDESSLEDSITTLLLKTYVAVGKDVSKNPEEFGKVVKSATNAAEKKYENLTGVDGDMYTLTINKDNVKTLLDDTEAFVKEDGQRIAEDFVTYIYKVAGENALGKSESELKEKIPDGVEKLVSGLENNKDKTIEALQKTNLDCVMKLNVNEGKDGKFAIAMKTDSDGTAIDYTADVEFKAGKASIADKIPKDANDITTMLKILMNQRLFNQPSEIGN